MSDTSNAPDYKTWPIPKCGVNRRELIWRHCHAAQALEIKSVANEIAQHFKAPAETGLEIAAVITAATPTFHQLDQIYRHAFHPLHLETIGEALVCPPKTLAKQLADAFAPVISMAKRIDYVPSKPRKRSKNPDTKDFQKFARRIGANLRYQASYGYGEARFVEALNREKDLCDEHLGPALDFAIKEARERLQYARNDVERAERALAKLEEIERNGGLKAAMDEATVRQASR